MSETELVLDLTRLHPVTALNAGHYERAARVCLSRDHTPPVDVTVSLRGEDDGTYETNWQEPDDDDKRWHANSIDATEIGAYCVALAAAYAHLGHMALRRTGTGTGGDWWLIPIGSDVGPAEYDLDRTDLVKLEVSGVSIAAEWEVRARLREKVQQVRKGRQPVEEQYAAVVWFPGRQVRFEKVG